jgi:hypothetical protein
MSNSLINVTYNPDLWSSDDPIHPELSIKFKTAPNRGVFGLLGDDNNYQAFLCYAKTTDVPRDINELDSLTDSSGRIIVPYTVWSYVKGCGREIINLIIDLAKNSNICDRIVTLSPQTEMAKKFHIRNSAVELRVNESTVNFEYDIK